MRTRAILLGCLALAACGRNEEQPKTVAEQEAAQIEAVRTLSGWDRIFASPLETVNSINQAGFGLPPYGPLDDGYGARGIQRLMSRSTAPSPNMGTASVSGATADRVDRISYGLALNDPQDADAARDRFATTIGEFLTRAKVGGGEPLLASVRQGRPGRVEVDGLPVAVNATPARIDVVFIRPTGAAARPS